MAAVFCRQCRFFDGHDTCCHPNSRTMRPTPIAMESDWRSVTERNAQNDCPDFARDRGILNDPAMGVIMIITLILSAFFMTRMLLSS